MPEGDDRVLPPMSLKFAAAPTTNTKYEVPFLMKLMLEFLIPTRKKILQRLNPFIGHNNTNLIFEAMSESAEANSSYEDIGFPFTISSCSATYYSILVTH